ncbi:MAG: type II secretion system protein [Candidatus Omnitrophota bacterium]
MLWLRNKRAFTFVEMMVVLVLFAVVGVSLFSSFIMGMKVWKRVTDTNFAERKALLGIARLSKELRSCFGYSKIGFSGQAHNITFANIVGDRVINMTYIFIPDEGIVYRYNTSMEQLLGLQEPGLPRKIISGIKDFTFKFYGPDQGTGNYTFLDNWNYTISGIPAAVKVFCSVDDDHDLEKIISIPIAQ